MGLKGIQEQLGDLVKSDWAEVTEAWGKKVALYRKYVDGEHRLDLTKEMAELLRIKQNEDERFAVNYAELVVTKMADRLIVERVEAVSTGEGQTVTKAANEWAKNIADENRFDALQIDVNEATLGDGDSFVMIDPAPLKEGKEYPGFVHEPAFDGEVGVIPVYDRKRRNMVAAVKIWEEAGFEGYRVNIYYEGRVEKWHLEDDSLTPVPVGEGEKAAGSEDDNNNVVAWTMNDGTPIGVPFGHFKNRSKTSRTRGKSEIAPMIPAQDVLNRTFMSMTLTGELTAFQRLVFLGIPAQDNMSPGVIIEATEKDADGNSQVGIPKESLVDVKALPAGEIVPFVQQAQFAIEQIGAVTDTPLPKETTAARESGETLKQKESGLLAKVRKTQVKFGNVWEDVFKLAHRVQQAYGNPQPVEIERFNTVWQDAQVRNDTEVVDNAMKVRDEVGHQKFLEIVAPVFDLDEDAIKDIVKQKETEDEARMNRLLAGALSATPGEVVPAEAA